jgi:putative transposase
MPQSLTQLYVHIVFSTKYREHTILPQIQHELYSYMGGILNNNECIPIKIGGTTDHVHILTRLSKKIPLMKVVEEVKRSSSKWVKTLSPKLSNFYWQDGYGAFTVGYSQIQIIENYITNQLEHHTRKTFQDEYRALLVENNVPFDERYVWD